MSRSRVALFVLIIALVVACASMNNNQINRSKTSATVIVSASGTVDQESVEICARNGMTPGGTPVPAHILWIADRSQTLSIDFPDRGQNCIRGLHCSGNSCEAIT